MEKYTNELRNFGAMFLAGFGNDIEKATEAMEKTNELMQKNPRIIPMLANEENQATIKQTVDFIESGKGNPIKVFQEIKKLGAKLKI